MKGLHRMLLQVDEDVWRIAISDDDLDAGIGNFWAVFALDAIPPRP